MPYSFVNFVRFLVSTERESHIRDIVVLNKLTFMHWFVWHWFTNIIVQDTYYTNTPKRFVHICSESADSLQTQIDSLGPLHTRDWEPMTITLHALSLVEKAEPVQVRFTLRLRDQRNMWMQDGCKVYMVPYTTSNRSCVIVTWTIFKNHLLEVGLTQNQETMALQTLTSVD